jgi:hypothetical protein
MINDDHHLGDDKAQYANWNRTRLLAFLQVHACRRLDMLRDIEEQRHIALPATSDQQKILLQLARELKDDNPGAAETNGCPTVSIDTEAATKGNAVEAQDAFDKLDPTERTIVRNASKTLLSLNNVMAERYSDHKQSALGKKDQDQEHAQGDQRETEDS